MLEYELFETGKTPSELLEYYKKMPTPRKTKNDDQTFDIAFSYQTEYKIYKAKLEILSKKIYLMRFASLKVIHAILNYKYRRKYFPQ